MAHDKSRRKYILKDDPEDFRYMFRPLEGETEQLLHLFGKRKWVTVLTKCDKYRHVNMRINVNHPKDMLVCCGDQIVVAQNPEHRFMIRSVCVKTKKWCIGYEGDVTHEFFAICPHCAKIMVAIRATDIKCDNCMKDVKLESEKKTLRWIRFDCAHCPVNIGLDAANGDLEYAYNQQQGIKLLDEDGQDEADIPAGLEM